MTRSPLSCRRSALTTLTVLCAMLPAAVAMAVEGLPEAEAVAKRLEAQDEEALPAAVDALFSRWGGHHGRRVLVRAIVDAGLEERFGALVRGRLAQETALRRQLARQETKVRPGEEALCHLAVRTLARIDPTEEAPPHDSMDKDITRILAALVHSRQALSVQVEALATVRRDWPARAEQVAAELAKKVQGTDDLKSLEALVVAEDCVAGTQTEALSLLIAVEGRAKTVERLRRLRTDDMTKQKRARLAHAVRLVSDARR